MKKEFIGFYNPTEKEIHNAWSKGTFAFDANTILNLYRYTENTRKDFLSAIKMLKPNLFLPYQVALEFHTNRIGVIEAIESSYENIFKMYESIFEKSVASQLNQYKKHPTIVIETFGKLHSDFLKKISSELDKQRKRHPDFKTKDDILNEVTDLFEDSIGKEFPKEEIKKIFDEGKIRYEEKRPPGYMDLESKKTKGDLHIYGDVIIWKELINYSKKERKSLIFVTDDRKEDWWRQNNGKIIRPREELIKEFFDLTGVRILIYSADSFLHFAKEKGLIPKLKENTIKEVKEIRISDEKSSITFKDMLKEIREASLPKVSEGLYVNPLGIEIKNTQDYFSNIFNPSDFSASTSLMDNIKANTEYITFLKSLNLNNNFVQREENGLMGNENEGK